MICVFVSRNKFEAFEKCNKHSFVLSKGFFFDSKTNRPLFDSIDYYKIDLL